MCCEGMVCYVCIKVQGFTMRVLRGLCLCLWGRHKAAVATKVPDEANMFQISAFSFTKLVSSITMVVFTIQNNSLLI